jgi:Ca2+:H+ antiporter
VRLQATSSLLFLSCIGITLPTAASMMWEGDAHDRAAFILDISRGTAIILLGM